MYAGETYDRQSARPPFPALPPSPALSLTRPKYIYKQLNFYGYHLHTFPVLALAELIVTESITGPENPSLLAYIYLLQHDTCQLLCMSDPATFWMGLAESM